MAIGKKIFYLLIFNFIIFGFSCTEKIENKNFVLTGADVLLTENLNLIENKNLGIITNHTAILKNGIHLVDTLSKLENIKIATLFSPEHGIRGNLPDGNLISDSTDTKTGIPIKSLYGNIHKPTKVYLKNIDLLIFDIQDVGARFYTYISTMYYAIQSASENNIPIIILDRPNPINGITVNGPMLDTNFTSFVGITNLPIQHGMTIGELANYFNQPEILKTEKPADLTIIKMKNWKREFYFDDCNLKWINPSPNIPNLETAVIYPGLCLIEGTNISEGRGTYSPFVLIGSPYINSNEVINEINKFDVTGLKFKDTTFTPVEIPNMSSNPKYKNEKCNGILIKTTDRNKINPIEISVKLIYTFHKLYPEKFSFRESSIDRLWGSNNFRENILSGKTPNEIIELYQTKLNEFKKIREKYLLY
ncbi:MAG: DUF1343 domain-containing protein [Ignavibacteriales bacterium]|nr:DUF1343 domain-containing protein [Ignavibacteriales bacterium]